MNTHHIGETVLSTGDIARGVSQVAAEINAHFTQAVIITVVPGGTFFTADLVRQLNIEVEMDYISCPHTPGERNNQSDIVYHQNIDIKNKHVIIIDDAIESGGTMKRLVAHIAQNFAPASVSVAVLFVKPGRVSIPVKQYYALEMENDDLLIGYGMPWEGKFRNLPFVARLNRPTQNNQ